MSGSDRILMTRTAALLALPEFNVMLFAVLVSYPWEFIQAPLYAGMSDQRHWDAVKTCTIAALGDGVLIVVAYWGTAWLVRNRRWIIAPTARAMTPFLLIGLCITIVIEWLAQRGWWLQQWNYSAAMPLIPGLGVGWVPVLQWMLLPPLVVGLVSRQTRGG
jgi:hypothetical protein